MNDKKQGKSQKRKGDTSEKEPVKISILHKRKSQGRANGQRRGINLDIQVRDTATYNTMLTDPKAADMLISGYVCVGTVLFFFNNQLNVDKSLRTFWNDAEFQSLLSETVKTGDTEDTLRLLDMVNEADNVHPITRISILHIELTLLKR